MRSMELGLVLPMEEAWTDGLTPHWVEIRELALRAEAIIADGIRAFRAGGFTQIEIMLWPRTMAALEAMAPALELLDAD